MTDTKNTEPPLNPYSVEKNTDEFLAWSHGFEAGAAHAVTQMQGEPDAPMVAVSENGEGQENECPVCGAEPGQMCSDESGREHGRKVHPERQAREITDAEIDDLMGSALWSPAARSNVHRVVRAAIALANGRTAT